MEAIVQHRYGSIDGLRLQDVPAPAPADDEVLVQVRATSVHPDVWHAVTGRPALLRLMGSGVRRPSQPIPGTDLAGVVVAVGAGVTRFKPGDEVFGETIRGHQWRNGGAYAELAVAPEQGLALKPPAVTFEEAAAVPTVGLITLQNLPQRRVSPGDRLLINGAAGGVGSIAVQLAKAYGAHVTAVDAAPKLEMLRRLGADRTIDYGTEDFTQAAEQWDLVFDIPGNHPFSRVRRVIAPGGAYVLIGHDAFGAKGHAVLGSVPHALGLMARSVVTPELRGGAMKAPDKQASMELLARLLQEGRLQVVIDRVLGLADAALALRHLASGQATGRIVLSVGG